MNPSKLLFVLLISASVLFGQNVTLVTAPDGSLVSPTNFFFANRQRIFNIISPFYVGSLGGKATNIVLYDPVLRSYLPSVSPGDKVVFALDPDSNLFMSDVSYKDLVLTNKLYRILPGTNMVATTNGMDVILSSTGGGGGGDDHIVGIQSSTLNISGSPITNSGTITINLADTYAPTSSIYRILPGTNIIAVTNGWDVTLSSIGGGTSTTNFSGLNVTNHIFMPNSSDNPRWRLSYDATTANLFLDRNHSGGGSSILRLRDIPYTTTNDVFHLNATARRFSLFNNYTDASNFEDGGMWWETNVFKIGTRTGGTGSPRNTVFTHNGNSVFFIETNNVSGHLRGRIVIGDTSTTSFGIGNQMTISQAYPAFPPRISWHYSGNLHNYIYGASGTSGTDFVMGAPNIVVRWNSLYMLFEDRFGFYYTNSTAKGTLELRTGGVDSLGTNFVRLVFGKQDNMHPAIWTGPNSNAFYIATGFETNAANAIVGFDPVNGRWQFRAHIDNTARTGSSTNAMSGRVTISSGTQTYYLTNSFVTADSVVLATVNSDDASAHSCRAIPSDGLLTLKLNAAADADCRVSWFIVKP